MIEAGGELGRIHRLFRDIDSPLAATTPGWRLRFDLDAKLAEIEGYLSLIGARASLDAFESATIPLLRRRDVLLAEVPRLLDELEEAKSQVLHGDYGLENLLFQREGALAAVVDFGPPQPFLVAYEIGRIAFPAEHFAQQDWVERGVALLAAYRDENPRAADQIRFAPAAWLVQLIRSTYGLKQHYGDPVEFQADLDRFWLQRARGAEILFDMLPAVMKALPQ